MGLVVVLPLWMLNLRDTPNPTMTNVKDLTPIAACHVLTHVCAMIGARGMYVNVFFIAGALGLGCFVVDGVRFASNP